MSDIHSTLSTCVCPHSRLGGAKKNPTKFVLFRKGWTCVHLFSRENVRGFVRSLFAFWKRKKNKTKIKAECTRVFTSVFRGRLHPNTSAVCHGSTGCWFPLSTADPICERGARDGGASHPSVPHFYVMYLQEGGELKQRALAACMHTNL